MPIIGIIASQMSAHLLPPVTSGLVRWYDGSDSTTMTISSGNISQWNSKSPATSGVNVTQATGSKQPNLVTNVKNGRSAVQFTDANEDNLFSSSQPTTGTGAFTVCLAAQQSSYSSDATIVAWGTSNAVGAGWGNFQTAANTLVGGYAGSATDNGIISTGTYAGNWATQVTTGNGTSIQGWMQKETKATKTTTSVNVSNNSEFFLGWLTNPWYSTYGWNGYIGDVLIYNRVLSDTEATTMRDWLQAKWGI